MPKTVISKTGGVFSLRPVRDWIASKPDGLYSIEVKRIRRRRTNPQNSWLWGCVYPLMMEGFLDLGWEFTSVEQVHECCKARFASDRIVNKATGEIVEFPASTAQMDTATFSAYCERLRDFSREYLGIEIPDPGEDVAEGQ